MKRHALFSRKSRLFLAVAGAALIVAGCGGSGDGSPGGDSSDPAALRTVTGTLDVDGSAQAATVAAVTTDPVTLTMDDETTPIPVDAEGRFEVSDVADGDHSFYVRTGAEAPTEIPFRMLQGRDLDLGTVRIRDGRLEEHTGFNGYHFGFVDEDGDGINDNFTDADGDGICDQGALYAGYPYMMEQGFVDTDQDGVNDHFRDADGDGLNDLDQSPHGSGFGFVDEDGDGINDRFVDADGDGICDLSGMPFAHPFGFVDEDGDGTNDRFIDADGDGVNDRTGVPYMAMPGWVDLDGDGINDFFRDADGDGIDDLSDLPLSYGHGFGFVDEDGDGINDRFIDANGDGINDYASGPFVGMSNRYGFTMPHLDENGDGIDDETGYPYCQGFGWIDADGDGHNDAFADNDGDGVNDWTGYHYDMGYQMDSGSQWGGGMGSDIEWPMHEGGMR